MTKEDVARIVELIDACRGRGVTSLKFDGIEFTLTPGAIAPGDPLAELTAAPPIDHSKCLVCQKAPQERGTMCRGCWLGQAGVRS